MRKQHVKMFNKGDLVSAFLLGEETLGVVAYIGAFGATVYFPKTKKKIGMGYNSITLLQKSAK